jgi:mono/diheme cytochrome c family protein
LLAKHDFRISRLKKVKEFRIVLVMAAVTTCACAVSFMPGPIQAAQQNAGLNKEAPARADTPPPQDAGAASYAKHCAICHGDQREGILPGFPPLLGINHRMTENKIADLIHTGKGRMPGFPNLQNGELTALLHYLTSAESSAATGEKGKGPSGLAEAGGMLFHQNCAFCHGRDAMGGETGPDLTESKLVLSDTTGEKIAEVVREGKPNNKMPGFNFSSQEIQSLIAFIHFREAEAKTHPGGRRGVSVEDLQTGNAKAGKEYFDGPGGCVKCHSPRGDLAGLANRYQGLQLERRMLYPRDATSTVTVTLPTGQKVNGTLAYRDEFTVALRDSTGFYRSWPTNLVRFTVQSPADAHVELFSKYTDEDIHNLMAYLQTLR